VSWDGGATVVHQRRLSLPGVDQDRRRARLSRLETDEAVRDLVLGQQRADLLAARAGDQSCAQDGAAEGACRARRIEALAAGQDDALDGVVVGPALQARDEEDAGEGGVERDRGKARCSVGVQCPAFRVEGGRGALPAVVPGDRRQERPLGEPSLWGCLCPIVPRSRSPAGCA
jgi:hypothetical protein